MMYTSTDVEEFIESYLYKCRNSKVGRRSDAEDCRKAKTLIIEIVKTFKPYIPNIADSLYVINYSGAINEDEINEDLDTLEKILRFYLLNRKDGDGMIVNNINNSNHSSVSGSGNSTNTVSPSISNTNTVTNTFDVKIELQKLRTAFEDEDDSEEINEKLDNIEAILNEDSSPKEKWKKGKDIFDWFMGKGFRFAKNFGPFFIKALFPEK